MIDTVIVVPVWVMILGAGAIFVIGTIVSEKIIENLRKGRNDK